jgi:twinkle protein
VLNLASVPFVDPANVPRIMTKIPELDHMIGGLEEGGVSVFSGKRGEGKSTLAGPLMLQAIQQGHSVCAYSGELPAYKFLEWSMLQATESKYISYKTDTRSGKNLCYVAPIIQQRIKAWLDGKFFLYDNSIIQESSQTESILKVFEACARRYGCKVFLVDNLMSALVSADEENKAQAKFTAQLKAFASKYKVHVILIAHPRKEKADSVFSNDSVSGSSAITNLADVVINVEKSPKGIRITKNRSFGITGFINCSYDPCNRRIFQSSTGDRVVYGWDHTDIPLPENPACTLDEFKIQDGREEDKQPF